MVLGLLAAPGLAADVAQDVSAGLPRLLDRRVSADVRWEVPTLDDEHGATDRGRVEIIDATRRRMLEEGWDLAISITDLPLRAGRRPLVADASATHGVALLSLPALGSTHLSRRAREAIVRLVDGLVGESLERGHDDHERRHRVGRRLAEVGAPRREVAPGDDPGHLRFVGATVRGHLRLLAGMVRANRPWRLVAHLSRALAATLGTVAVALVSPNVWRIVDALDWRRLAAMTVGSVTALVVWLIVDHELWERPSGGAARSRAVLFNTATTLTVALGVLCLYAALFVLSLVGAALVIDAGLLGETLRHRATSADYVTLAWAVASLATVGGALGSGLESDDAVREAAYGYRPDRRSEAQAARAGSDGDGGGSGRS